MKFKIALICAVSLIGLTACNQPIEVQSETRTLYPSIYASVVEIFYLNETAREAGIKQMLPNFDISYLYYYNEKLASAEKDCDLDAILPIERENTAREDRFENTIFLLTTNELTEEEKEQGFVNKFPEGFELVGAGTSEGIDLTFTNPEVLKGDSCDTQIMKKQIEKTVNQSRPDIEYVKFLYE